MTNPKPETPERGTCHDEDCDLKLQAYYRLMDALGVVREPKNDRNEILWRNKRAEDAEAERASLAAQVEALRTGLKRVLRGDIEYAEIAELIRTPAPVLLAERDAKVLENAADEIPEGSCYLTGGDDNITTRWLRAKAKEIRERKEINGSPRPNSK